MLNRRSAEHQQKDQLGELALVGKRQIRAVRRTKDPAGSQQSSRASRSGVTKITAPGPLDRYSSPVPIFPDDLSRLRDVKLPVRFRVGAATLEHPGETVAISATQFIMSSALKLDTGMRLTITVHVPMEISGNPFSEVNITGRIVSVSEIAEKKFGYQVELDPRG